MLKGGMDMMVTSGGEFEKKKNSKLVNPKIDLFCTLL
jgi:hypothetical protein